MIPQTALIISSARDFIDYYTDYLRKLGFEIKVAATYSDWQSQSYQPDLNLCCIDNRREKFEFDKFFYQLSKFSPHSIILCVGGSSPAYPHGGNLVFSAKDIGADVDQERFLRSIHGLYRRGESRTELAAMLIHDIRSPLNSLIAYIELMLNETFGELNEGQQKFLEKAMILGDQTLDMLEDINEIYKSEQYTFTLDKEFFPISGAIDQALVNLWAQTDQKDIKIKKEIPSDFPLVYGDEFQIQRVMINLLENAIKYCPPNSTITIETEKLENAVQISIADDGTGISDEDLANIFKKSYRSRDEDKLIRVKGHGLGLYICKLIVKTHGGLIRAENNAEGGVSFIFTLPRAS